MQTFVEKADRYEITTSDNRKPVVGDKVDLSLGKLHAAFAKAQLALNIESLIEFQQEEGREFVNREIARLSLKLCVTGGDHPMNSQRGLIGLAWKEQFFQGRRET